MKELSKLFVRNLVKVAMLLAVSCIIGIILYSAMQFLRGIFGFWFGMAIMGALIIALVVTVCTAADWKAQHSSDDEEDDEESEETEE